MSPAVVIRPAQPDDLPAVTTLYNQGITERIATFETDERTLTEIETWLPAPLPFLVACCDGDVAGWARITPYSPRHAYRGVGEHSVYVDRQRRGHGVARAL
ncbi:MAG: GNAT family N-acetyltransferase, partial [Patulibacter sp.]|nr:GNAT family N-acetyltransferase [Patulibacter sp.]